MIEKEEYTIVLDYLPYGYPLERKMMPLAQAVGIKNFTLLELVPRKGISLQAKEKVYIGEGKRDKVYYILGKLPAEKLTEAAKINLAEFIGNAVSENEEKFVDFFNKAEAVNTRLHQLELLPGFGKKHTMAIMTAREEKAFENFEDIKKKVSNIPDPKKAIEKRILQEIGGGERQRLFVM